MNEEMGLVLHFDTGAAWRDQEVGSSSAARMPLKRRRLAKYTVVPFFVWRFRLRNGFGMKLELRTPS